MAETYKLSWDEFISGRNPPTEWQCTCGTWVPMAYGRHPHLHTAPAAFADLHAARIAQEAGLSVPDATEGETVLQYVWRTPEMPTR